MPKKFRIQLYESAYDLKNTEMALYGDGIDVASTRYQFLVPY